MYLKGKDREYDMVVKSKIKWKGAMRLKIMQQFYSCTNLFQAAMKRKLQMKSVKFQIPASFLKLCDLRPVA